jgi:hypothetical protein
MSLELLSNGLIACGGIALGIAFVLLCLLYRREAKGARRATSSTPYDLTNMTILMQTMRDMLEKQKALAAEFNKSLDNKVTVIRKAVRAVREEHERLSKTQQEIHQLMTATRADLNRLRAYAASAAQGRMRQAAPLPQAAGISEGAKPSAQAPGIGGAAAAGEEPERPFSALASPELSRGAPDLIDNWVGLDFGVDEPSPYAFEVPEEPPETPEDPETAREAFRRLLDLSEESQKEVRADKADAVAVAAQGAERNNGRSRSATLRARVLQYRQAGMSVPEIARELGLGKGEVRLILSIGVREANHRKQRNAQRDQQAE